LGRAIGRAVNLKLKLQALGLFFEKPNCQVGKCTGKISFFLQAKGEKAIKGEEY
jgi:hypothetical protein